MIRFSFAEWLRLVEVRDTSNAAMQASASKARDIGRNANTLIGCLIEKHNGWTMRHSGIGSKADVTDKIDAWFTSGPHNGDSIQIIRRIAAQAKDDFAIQVVSKQSNEAILMDQNLEDLIQGYGSKLSADAQWHIMLNADDTTIFIANINDIRRLVDQAVQEMKRHPRFRGQFSYDRRSFFDRNTGVNLRVAQSREGYSVLAYVPAASVAQMTIPVNAADIASCETATAPTPVRTPNPLGHTPPPATKSDMEIAAEEAEKTGTGTITIKSTNPRNIEKKIKEIRTFASTRRLRVTDNKDGTVTLSKW